MEVVPRRKLELYTGRSHPELAEAIAAHLGVQLGDPNLREFADGFRQGRQQVGVYFQGDDPTGRRDGLGQGACQYAQPRTDLQHSIAMSQTPCHHDLVQRVSVYQKILPEAAAGVQVVPLEQG